jgi:hypothetical protein
MFVFLSVSLSLFSSSKNNPHLFLFLLCFYSFFLCSFIFSTFLCSNTFIPYYFFIIFIYINLYFFSFLCLSGFLFSPLSITLSYMFCRGFHQLFLVSFFLSVFLSSVFNLFFFFVPFLSN